MQRGGISPLLVSAVDVLSSEKLLHAIQVPLLGCIQQSTVPPQQVRQVTLLLLHQVQTGQVVPVPTIHIRSMLREKKKELD